MIVISDTSPLITFWGIGHLDVLASLYGEVVIPCEVEAELRTEQHSDSAEAIFVACRGWLKVMSPQHLATVQGLDPGETAAITLAKELGADLLIIDEKLGRKVANCESVPVIGTIGVLIEAAKAGLIDLTRSFERIKKIKFRISHEFLAARLADFNRQQRDGSDGKLSAD